MTGYTREQLTTQAQQTGADLEQIRQCRCNNPSRSDPDLRESDLAMRCGDDVLGLVAGVSAYAADVAQAIGIGYGRFNFALAVLPRKNRRFGTEIKGTWVDNAPFILPSARNAKSRIATC